MGDHVRLSTVVLLSRVLGWPASLIVLLFVVLYAVVFVSLQIAVPPVCCTCVVDRILKCWLAFSACLAGIIMGIPFLAFCSIWALVALPLWLMLVPCGTNSSTLFDMVSAPPVTLITALEMLC